MGLLSRIKKSLGAGDEAAQEAPAPAAPVSAAEVQSDAGDSSEVLAVLKGKIVELANGQISLESVEPNAILFDFGYVDSLSAVTLISFVEEQYKVSITELDLVGSLNTLQALSDHITRLAAS